MPKKKKPTIEEMFLFEHNNPPAPFNPLYDPKASARYKEVTTSMERDNFYTTHTREECKIEWGQRYSNLSLKDNPDGTKI